MTRRKPDAHQIIAFLKGLADEEWVRRSECRHWPRFLFHYTAITNVATILQEGYLYSRTGAECRKLLSTSSGDPGILSQTDDYVKDCARLYFRPRTPTQYHAEGIRSKENLSSNYPDAHCPVPIFLLFDAPDVLTRSDSRFSSGNLRWLGRSDLQLCSTAAELMDFPWRKIYHNTWFSRHETDIIFHRNAEVVVPQRLPIDALRYVHCRSQAEKDTLRFLLPPKLWEQYRHRVTATSSTDFYFRKHTYIRKADLFADRCLFVFSPETTSPGPFTLTMELDDGDRVQTRVAENYLVSRNNFQLDVPFHSDFYRYIVRLYLDDHLAYAGIYDGIPF